MDKKQAKAEFGSRLTRLCDESPLIRPMNRGRLVDLSKAFGVSQESARRWIDGKNFPEMGHIEQICDFFGANIGWLMSGKGAPYKNQIADTGSGDRYHIKARFLPVLEPDDALSFSGSYHDLEPIDWYPTDLETGDYWLIANDESLSNGSLDSINPGTMLLVEHGGEPKTGELAIVHLPEYGETFCREIIKQGPARSAVAWNKNYPPIDLVAVESRVVGTVADAIVRIYRKPSSSN